MHRIYDALEVIERHRHRYEVNPNYHEHFKSTDFIFSAFDDSKSLVEAIELKGHPFFIGIQAHPEFLSRPLRPHPLFRAFLRAAESK